MTKRKKLSECEERAIVTLEARRIKEKEQKQKAREKRKRENEVDGSNKKIVLGGQVLPYQTGIQARVPEQSYVSYSTSQEPSFEQQIRSMAVSQAPAALQAYLFMNSGQHRERRQLVRDQQVQAGGNVVGARGNRNLQLPGPWFVDPEFNMNRADFDPVVRAREQPDVVDRAIAGIERGAGRLGRGALGVVRGIGRGGLGLARGIRSAAGGLASGAGSAFGKLGNFAGNVYQDAINTSRALQKFAQEREDEQRQSLLKDDVELDNFNQNSENDLRNRNQPSEQADDEKINESMSADELADAAKNQQELDNYERLKDNEAKRQYNEAKAFADGINAALEGDKTDTIEMQDIKVPAAVIDDPQFKEGSTRRQVRKIVVNDPQTGKQIFRQYLNANNQIKTNSNEILMSMRSSEYGLNGEGYLVDRFTGRYLHKDYKEARQRAPRGYSHWDQDVVDKLKADYKKQNIPQEDVVNISLLDKNALNKTVSDMSMGGTPRQMKEEEDTAEMNTSTIFNNEDSMNDSVIPNAGINESYYNSFSDQATEPPRRGDLGFYDPADRSNLSSIELDDLENITF
jgi:hypothetical protein